MALPSYQDLVTMIQEGYRLPFQHPLLRLFALFLLFSFFRYLSAAKVRHFHSKRRLDGKVAVITGGNRGLGKETAKDLVRRGCHVVLACRNIKAGDIAKVEIVSSTKTSNQLIDVLPLDLTSFDSIKSFATRFGSLYAKLDILIHNAGVLKFTNTGDRCQSPQITQINDVMRTNYYGPFLLTRLLLNKMKQGGNDEARIIYVTSGFYNYATLESLVCVGDSSGGSSSSSGGVFRSLFSYIPLYKYFQSKCAAMAFSQEFTERVKGTDAKITFNCVNPGSVATDLFRNVPEWIEKPFRVVRRYCFKTTEDGVQTVAYAAVSEELEGVSGKYLVDNREEKLHECVKNRPLNFQLWEQTQRIIDEASQ